MEQDLAGRVAVVTGGAHGVGRAVVDRLAVRGAHVVVNYLRSETAAQETARELGSRGLSVELVRASIARREQVSRMFDTVAERHGRVDVLVNNAASGGFGRPGELRERDWERALGTNLKGTLWCSEHAAALMPDGGVIVNLSSLGSSLAPAGYAAVGTSKAAVEALTRYLAVEYGPRGIRVNTASAGPLDNGTFERLSPDRRAREAIVAATPLGRLGTEDDLADVAAFLVSSAARWITGQVVVADGGLSLGAALFAPPVDTDCGFPEVAWTRSPTGLVETETDLR